jgi:signal transduction histidine kinase
MQEILKRKQEFTASPFQFVTSQRDTAIQLGLSHIIAGGIGLGMNFWMSQVGLPAPYPLVIALGTACVVGLLCTLNLQYSLYLLELALSHLAHDRVATETPSTEDLRTITRRWPLIPLFARLQEVGQRMRHYAANEVLTSELRAKTLQQTGEAAAQAERNRIARELHDSIKQQIFSISISAAAAKAHWQGQNGGNAREAVEDIQRSAKEAQIEMQALLQQLRPAPLENTSLLDALQVQAQALGFRTGAQVHVEIGAMPDNQRLLPGTPEAIFRLVQEAFANIAKHARAQTIWLSLHSTEQSLRVEVRDDGQGFDLAHAPRGMGLNNLRERAEELHGQVEIKSQPGQGTRIVITLPLLEMLSSPEDEERQQYRLARASEFSRSGYQLGENAAFLGIALIIITLLFKVHWLAVVLVTLVSLYGYGRGMYYRVQVALESGPGSTMTLELKRLEYRTSLNFARLFGLSLWYSFNQFDLLQSSTGWWLLAGLLLVMTVWIQFVRRRYYVDTERYYTLLPAQERSWELERRRQGLMRSLALWFIACLTGLASARVLLLPLVAPFTVARGTAYGVTAILLILGFGLFTEYFQIQRWRHIRSTPGNSAAATSAQEK